MEVPTPLERRSIGKTGYAVSLLGLGCAPLGGLYRASSMADAQATVHAAVVAGVNYFDVAPHYGRGLAEHRLGRSLSAFAPDDIVLSTKAGRLLQPQPEGVELDIWPEALPYGEIYDVSDEGIRRSLRDSRERLGRDRIDLLLLHDPDRYGSGETLRQLIAQAYRTLARLRDEGEVGAIGLGVNAPTPCHMALDVGSWDCLLLAGSYSVLRQDDEGVLDRCAREGVSVMVGGPYMSGALAGGTTWRYRPMSDEIAGHIASLRRICIEHEIPIEAAALQFPLLHPAVASVVVGMRTPDEVQKNRAFLDTKIPVEFWRTAVAAGYVGSAVIEGTV